MSFARTLVRATARLQECIEHAAPGAPKESRSLLAGLRESCTTLGDLLIDPELLHYLRPRGGAVTLEEGRRQLDAYRDNRQALERFLEAERELLQRAGVPVSASDYLVRRIYAVIQEKREQGAPELFEGLGGLKELVCDRVDRTAKDRNRAVLVGMRDFFGGLTVATLNGGLLAVSVGLSGAASAASITAGGVIAADGYSSVRKLF